MLSESCLRRLGSQAPLQFAKGQVQEQGRGIPVPTSQEPARLCRNLNTHLRTLLTIRAIIISVALSNMAALAAVYNLKVVTDGSPDAVVSGANNQAWGEMLRLRLSKWEKPAGFFQHPKPPRQPKFDRRSSRPSPRVPRKNRWKKQDGRWTMRPSSLITRASEDRWRTDERGWTCTGPSRQFNDYGYTMCSTIAGINCSIWDAMRYRVKFWDMEFTLSEAKGLANTKGKNLPRSQMFRLRLNTPEVEYDGRWHMYDNSMSVIYTLCDGKTVAGVEDIGGEGACEASGGRVETGHITKYHCLNADSPNGFLTGADCPRDLDQEYRCFNPNGLKYRYYYNNWDRGHRYILNLRKNEAYTRYYSSLDDSASYYVSNNGEDPEAPNRRYKIRGNGIWTFTPLLTAEGLTDVYYLSHCKTIEPFGLVPTKAGTAGEVVFKIQGANVITSMTIKASFFRNTEGDLSEISISTTNGLSWKQVWTNQELGQTHANVHLVDKVNGVYEVLVRVVLQASDNPADSCLKHIEFRTTTMLNSKTQPKLLLGKNTVYVGLGEQTDSIVLWPDLQDKSYYPYVAEQKNIVSEPEHPGYKGVMHAVSPNEDGYVVFRIDAPGDITRVTYGGRFYNRTPQSHIDLLHSFDGGTTWQRSYSLTRTDPPWDVICYQTVEDIPAGTRSVLLKYLLNSSAAGTDACSIYSVRMEVNYRLRSAVFEPFEVTFNWSEVQQDYSLVERSHTQLVTDVPFKYTVNVAGCDHPVMNWVRVSTKGTVENVAYGYSDGRDVAGEKYVPKWVRYGRNLANGRPYTVSVPSKTHWGAGDPDGNKLTDGVIGPPYAGGVGPKYALCWDKGDDIMINVDLREVQRCGAFRIHLSAGWPWWDAMKGEIKDRVEVLTSTDGANFMRRGLFNLNLRHKDIPVNHMMPDDETATGFTYALVPQGPIEARWVRFEITPQRTLTVSEVEVLDSIRFEPFDLRIALPDDG